MNPSSRAKCVLVTGATGTVGRAVVSELRRAGRPVRILVRKAPAGGIPEGVEVLVGDLAAPETFAAGLDGVDAVFLMWPLYATDVVPALLDVLARHARRIVYLSAASVEGDRAIPPVLFHTAIEQAIERSPLAWTFLRPTGFATNTRMWAAQIREHGIVRWPYGAAARSLIHELDIAAVAARALVEDGHAGARYVLTGPETLTQIEQVRIIGEAIGRPLHYEELSPDEARTQLLATWGNPGFVEAALAGWARMVAEPEGVTRTVNEVTGAPARTFRQWAQDHASEFRTEGCVKRFENKVALITGGTTGIGLATAKALAAEGARVTVTGTNPVTLAAAHTELRGLASVVASDAGAAGDLEQLAATIAAKHGAVDVLFLNAGVTRYGLITDMDEASFDESIRVNFKGPWLAIKHFAALMARGGSVVVNTSVTHQLGQPYTSVYAATKAALRSLTRSAAAELAARGVRVNAVSPGPTDTPIHAKQGLDAVVRAVVPHIPLGRLGLPDDIAQAVLFLASDAASFITGEELVIDGGMTRIRM